MRELDRQILRLYLDQIEKLVNTTVGTAGTSYQLAVSFKQGMPLKIDVKLPNNEEVAAFLLAFRPIYLQGEAINFHKMANLVHKVLDTADPKHPLKTELTKARKHFTNTLDKPSARLVYNNGILTPRKLIDLWFNAYYFHKDLEKHKEFEALRNGLGNLFPFFFLDAVFDWPIPRPG